MFSARQAQRRAFGLLAGHGVDSHHCRRLDPLRARAPIYYIIVVSSCIIRRTTCTVAGLRTPRRQTHVHVRCDQVTVHAQVPKNPVWVRPQGPSPRPRRSRKLHSLTTILLVCLSHNRMYDSARYRITLTAATAPHGPRHQARKPKCWCTTSHKTRRRRAGQPRRVRRKEKAKRRSSSSIAHGITALARISCTSRASRHVAAACQWARRALAPHPPPFSQAG